MTAPTLPGVGSSIELVDLPSVDEPMPPCDLLTCVGGRPPASWLYLFTCGCRALACQPCDRLMRRVEERHPQAQHWQCGICSTVEWGRLVDLCQRIRL